MVAIGFHNHGLNGIDSMNHSYSKVVIQLFFALILLSSCNGGAMGTSKIAAMKDEYG